MNLCFIKGMKLYHVSIALGVIMILLFLWDFFKLRYQCLFYVAININFFRSIRFLLVNKIT